MKHHSPVLPLHLSSADLRHLLASFASRCWAAHLGSRAAHANQQSVWCGDAVDWQSALKRDTPLRVDTLTALHSRSARPRLNKARLTTG